MLQRPNDLLTSSFLCCFLGGARFDVFVGKEKFWTVISDDSVEDVSWGLVVFYGS